MTALECGLLAATVAALAVMLRVVWLLPPDGTDDTGQSSPLAEMVRAIRRYIL